MTSRFVKKSTLFVAAAFAVAAFLSPASAQTKWTLPTGYPANNFQTENVVAFAKDVEQLSGGKLLITVHPGAALFKLPDIKRAVQTGQAQAGEVLLSIHENENPLFGLDSVPFLAASYAANLKLWNASKVAINKALDAQGLKVLYAVAWPPQGLYTKKDINSVEDMKGLKWRAYNVGTARIGELVNAQAVTIQAAELPQALATGVVNAYMTSGSTGYDSKTWESMDHYYDLQAWLPRNIVFVNKAAFEALDKPTQEAVLKAAAEAETRGWRISAEKTDWYLKELAAHGMKVLKPSPELDAGLRKIGDQLTADWLKKAGPEGAAIVEAYKKM